MAANTDLFKKLARRWVGQIGSGGVADNSTTTIPLASTTNLPTGTAVVLVIDRVDSNGTSTPTLEETIIGVVSGSNIINAIRGSEGTAQAHNAGAVVEVLVTAKGYNDLIDGILEDHTQLGYHKDLADANGVTWIKQLAVASAVNYLMVGNAITGSDVTMTASGTDSNIGIIIRPKGTGITTVDSPFNYGADAGANDTYVVTIKGIAALVTGLTVNFKANTANTGAATLNVNSLGAITIKKNRDQDLATGDIEANQIVTLIYDGTNFQMQSQVASSSGALSSKTGSFTRDMTAASGNVAYTGVGFMPTSIHFIGLIGGGQVNCEGFVDSALGGVGKYYFSTTGSGAASDLGANTSIALVTAASNYQGGAVASFDADGFTITWTKGATPTGTATINYIAYK